MIYFKKSAFLFLCLLALGLKGTYSQSLYQPYSYDFYQKLNIDVYNINTKFHSSLKPFFRDDSLIIDRTDSLLNIGIDTNRKRWVGRKIFNEHLVEINNPEYRVYIDFLPDMIIGRDISTDKNTWLNTRGFQIGGTVGRKFSFYTSGYENQGKFADYYREYSETHKVIPGQSREFFVAERGIYQEKKDWQYVTALISYTPIKYLNITAGYDKNFIGDGYRSLLLSDFATPYPFLKLTGNLGNIQYTAIWAAMQDPSSPKFSYESGNRKKGGVFHYLDWNVTDRLSVGFFDAVIWADADSLGNKRGFDWGYANPLIFLRPVEATSGSPDNAVIGLTAKYELFPKMAVYGQFALDEFEAKNFFKGNGSVRNKWGLQLGIRGADFLNVSRLNYLVEFNTVRPYTFTERTPIINYAHYNEPLGHPYGANFREYITKFNYSINKFDFSAQFLYSRYGLDKEGINYGKDIFKAYLQPANVEGNYIGQGLGTDLYYIDTRISYLVNPKYNLRIEAGAVRRKEDNQSAMSKTSLITFGLRSSFRNLYQDF